MIAKLLEQALESNADGPAVLHGGHWRTWRETEQRVLALASTLARTGVEPGDRVALLSPNSAAFLEATFAVARVGGVLVPLNLRLAVQEQVAVLVDAEAKLVLVDEEPEQDLRASLAGGSLKIRVLGLSRATQESNGQALPAIECRAEDPAHLYYTSGTTGRAKGVILTHGNVVAHARNAIEELALDSRDRWAHIAPMFHLADAWATLALTAVGGSHTFLPSFDAAQALHLLGEQRVTLTNLVPTMLNDMTRHPRAAEHIFSHLRLLLSGGAPIAPSLVQEVEGVFGCPYAQTYGLTETSPFLTISLLDERHRDLDEESRRLARARTGRPFRGVEVQVVDEQDNVVPADDRSVGEVRARGETVTPGYWRRPQETQSAIRKGWFYTGDLAVVDALGSLRIVDRKKDMILTGAECVYSTEVEAVLSEHEDLHEVAVFGLPDEKWGEAVHAAVVPKAGRSLDTEALRSFCRERLANYKVPKGIHVLEVLPRLGSGKLAKRILRDGLRLDQLSR